MLPGCPVVEEGLQASECENAGEETRFGLLPACCLAAPPGPWACGWLVTWAPTKLCLLPTGESSHGAPILLAYWVATVIHLPPHELAAAHCAQGVPVHGPTTFTHKSGIGAKHSIQWKGKPMHHHMG